MPAVFNTIKKNKMYNKKEAFSLMETVLVVIVLGCIATAMLLVLKPNNIKTEAILKNASNMIGQINFATTNILAKNSKSFSMTDLVALDGTNFSIVDDKADEKLIALYKKSLIALRKTDIPSSYLSSELSSAGGAIAIDESKNLKISDFSKYFVIRNGTFFALKLNGNCATVETYIYDPMTPNKNSVENSCGLIFFDVNIEEAPNLLGVDQYIISIGKRGIK